MNQQNLYNHLTAKERDTLSYPARILLNKNVLDGNVLDFGCGFGRDVKLLKEKGITIDGYDKYYLPSYPTKKYDTIICFYVLNVLMPEEQTTVLIEISQLLKPTGKAYFAVRRDVKFEGFRTHKIHQKPTYQCNVTLPYNTFFKNENCEIYEYRHYNQLKRSIKTSCPFCQPASNLELIAESATAYAILDKYPVNPGHTLIIPKNHEPNYFDLSFKKQSACWFLINKVKEIITKIYNPDGFNIGININKPAGQTVFHAHIHLIPRFEHDVENPTGGVRGVIKGKTAYSK
ncbi:MAG: HIT domain-containing protein [Imperialibacter sp.]|uniref:HIT domain-containing protein n=1 Tax=Imperialibacter sp. TaxID=2038411 RepID=UPI003A876359